MDEKTRAAEAARIKKLLDLAHSTHSPHEAEAAFAKARALLDKCGLKEGEAALYAEGIREVFLPYGYTQRPRWIEDLADAVACGFGCRYYVNEYRDAWTYRNLGRGEYLNLYTDKDAGFRRQHGFVLIGFDLDLQVAEHAYYIARKIITRLATAYLRDVPQKRKYVARMSFSEGACAGLKKALLKKDRPSDKARAAQGGEQSDGKEIVLAVGLREKKKNLLEDYEKRLDLQYLGPKENASMEKAWDAGVVEGGRIKIAPGLHSGEQRKALGR